MRASQRNNFKDDRCLRQEDRKEVRMAEAGDNKWKIYFKYEEKAYKKPQLVDYVVVYEFTIPQEESFKRIEDQGLLKIPFLINTTEHLRNKSLV